MTPVFKTGSIHTYRRPEPVDARVRLAPQQVRVVSESPDGTVYIERLDGRPMQEYVGGKLVSGLAFAQVKRVDLWRLQVR